MAEDVTLMVLPGLAAGEGGSLPRIFLEQKGIWRDLSSRDQTDARKIQEFTERKLKRYMTSVVEKSPVSVWPKLTTLGLKTLYEQLLPERLRGVLKEAAATAAGDDIPILRIHTRQDWIPWELMHDETDFLGLRFQIARLPIVPTAPDPGDGEPHKVDRIYSLLAQHLLKDAVQFGQWQSTFSGLVAHEGQQICYPGAGSGENGYPTLLDLMDAEDPDIVHITCHGGEVDQDDGKVYWTLDHKHAAFEDYRINKDDVATLGQTTLFFVNTRPLVFGNACASAKAAAAADSDSGVGLLDAGFGTTFFAQGASAFVGTLAPITEELSVKFASVFYQRLLVDGLPVGKALWATKKHFAELAEKDPSYLFYCLYGPPETRYQIA